MKTIWNLLVVTVALTFSSLSFANEITIKTEIGDKLTLNVEPDDSFLNVLESISLCFDSTETPETEDNFDSIRLLQESNKKFTMDVFVAGSKISKVVAKQQKNTPRIYWNPVLDREKEDVTFILRTLANNSWVKIIGYKKSLEDAGERVDHLHPFKWLLCILSDEELKSYAHVLKDKKGLAWKGFLNGTTTTLEQESSLENLKSEYVIDLSAQLNIDPNLISPSLKEHRWKEFVNVLIDNVPWQGGSKRYNQ